MSESESKKISRKQSRKTGEGDDELFKLVLVGDSGVGKSSLLIRFADDYYADSFISTIGVDFRIKTVDIGNGTKVTLQIWDTAGQERFRNMTSSYYRDAEGIIIVFDLGDLQSFEHLEQWMREIDNIAPKDVVKLVVGNKADLLGEDRQVSADQIKSWAENYDLQYAEVSAKTRIGVDTAFTEMAKRLFASSTSRQRPVEPKMILQNPSETKVNTSSCCWRADGWLVLTWKRDFLEHVIICTHVPSPLLLFSVNYDFASLIHFLSFLIITSILLNIYFCSIYA